MIETPYPIHTHSKSTSYMYKEFQHMLLWLTVIWMQPNMISYLKMYYSSLPAPSLVGESLGFLPVMLYDILSIEAPHTLH